MIILFLVSLIILVILHEAAHLIVAKLCGCEVEVYSIGFWKPVLFSHKWGGTVYQITPWLLGGYCALKDELERNGARTKGGAFITLPYRKKFAISIAGCFINVVTGLLAMHYALSLECFNLYFFGYLSLILGLTNWFLPIPCLDGGYALWYPILIKKYGYVKGTKIFAKSVNVSFTIVSWLNILSIPWLIYLFKDSWYPYWSCVVIFLKVIYYGC